MSSWFIRRANVVNSAGGRLPAEFKELAYLQGDGNAYINTGFTLSQNDSIILELSAIDSGVDYQVFGYRDTANRNNIACFIGPQGEIGIDFNSSNYATYRVQVAKELNKTYTIYNSKTRRAVYLGSTLVYANTNVCNDAIATGNALLFYVGGSPYSTKKFKGRVSYLEVTGRCILIPAMRKDDSVVGMYDLVSDAFLTNAGTGTFSYGEL